MEKLTFALTFLLCFQNLKAQKEKVTEEKIVQVCKDVPIERRPRLTVARFSVSSPNRPDGQFGDNLATMLTNALQGAGCFRVLERLKDSSDMMDEMNFGQSANANKKTSLQKGKMLVANTIATGEITKYEASSKTTGIGPVKTTRNQADIGVIIKLINPENREVITSHEFNVSKKTDGGMRIGVGVPLVGDINLTSSSMKNPAVQSAVEEALKQAVVFIAGEKDKIPLPEASSASINASESTISITNIDYNKLSFIASSIEKIKGVISVKSEDFSENTATILVQHSCKFKGGYK